MDITNFSTESLVMLLRNMTKLIEEDDMPEHYQRDIFDRLTTPMKPDKETIECLFLGWMMKHYMSLAGIGNDDEQDSSYSGESSDSSSGEDHTVK